MCDFKYFAFSQLLTIGGWLATIFHDESIIFSDQSTPWIDKPTHKINPSLLHYHAPSGILQGVMIYDRGGWGGDVWAIK